MFSVEEIVKATTGKLIHGSFKDRVSGISTDSRKLKPQEAFLAVLKI